MLRPISPIKTSSTPHQSVKKAKQTKPHSIQKETIRPTTWKDTVKGNSTVRFARGFLDVGNKNALSKPTESKYEPYAQPEAKGALVRHCLKQGVMVAGGLYMGGKAAKSAPKIPAAADTFAKTLGGRVADTAINLWPWNQLTPVSVNYADKIPALVRMAQPLKTGTIPIPKVK